jgi:hypothetical protein
MAVIGAIETVKGAPIDRPPLIPRWALIAWACVTIAGAVVAAFVG